MPDRRADESVLLRDFLDGSLPPDRQPEAERLLERDPDALTLVDEHANIETFAGQVRADLAAPGFPEEQDAARIDAVCEAVLKQFAEPAVAETASVLPPGDPSAPTGPQAPSDPDHSLALLAPAQGPGEIGRLNGYRVLRELGRGGMGLVFEAEDIRLKRRVALKVMRPDVAARDAHGLRFLREAQTAAQVEHDHICPIHQVGEEGGVPFIAMPLLKGESLDARLKRQKPLPAADAVRIARQAALGLAAAHAQGLVHRDVKPGNVWLEAPAGRVKLLDFGLARSRAEDTSLTASGAVMGTPAYMAPEQARGRAVDHRADLFSLGCVLYEMLTGRRPFTGPDTMAVLTSLAVDDPPAPHIVNPACPPALSDLTMELLAKAPDRRPASADAVADRLAALATPTVEVLEATVATDPWSQIEDETEAVPTAAPVPPTGSAKPAPRKRRVFPLVAVGVLAVGLGLLALFGGTVYRIATNKGELVVEIDDKDVEVKVVRDGVVVQDKTTKREFTLAAGAGEIEVYEKDGVKLTTRKFELTRNGKTTVAVTIPELADARKPQPKAGAGPAGGRKDAGKGDPGTDGDRRLAEWVRGLGGNWIVSLDVTGSELYSPKRPDFPAGPFRVITVFVVAEGGQKAIAPADLELFRGATALRRVHIESPLLTSDTVTDLLAALPASVRDLGLGGPVGDGAFARLDRLRGLEALQVNSPEVTDGLYGHLKAVPGLRRLSLNGCTKLTGDGLAALAEFKRLESLGLGQFRQPEQALPRLAALGGLRELKLYGTEVTAAGVKKLAAALPQCKIEWDGGAIEPRPVPLSPEALVIRPAPVPGLAGWTVETVGHRGAVWALAYHKDGRLLASLGADNTVRVWDTAAGKLDRLFVPTPVRQARAWTPTLAWSADGAKLAAVTSDGSASVWEYATGKRLLESGPAESVNSVAWAADGRLLAVGNRAKQADGNWADGEIWWADTGKTLRPVPGYWNLPWVRWSPDRKWLFGVPGNGNGVLVPLDPGGKEVALGTEIGGGSFSPDGRWLVFRQGPGTLRTWNLAAGKVEKEQAGFPFATVYDWAPDGRTLLYLKENSKLTVLDVAGGKDTVGLATPDGLSCAAWAPDGKVVAVGNWGTIRTVSALSGTEVHATGMYFGHAAVDMFHDRGAAAVLSPDRQFLALARGPGGSATNWVHVWDTTTKRPVRTVVATNWIADLRWRPDGRQFAFGTAGPVQLADPRRGGVGKMAAHAQDKSVAVTAWSPDGTRLATGGRDGAFVTSPGAGRKPVRLNPDGGSHGVSAMAWSPDGKQVMTCQYADRVRVWDAATGQLIRELPKDVPTGLLHLAWSPDGRLIGGSGNRRGVVFDAVTGEVLDQWEGVFGVTHWLEDGTLLVPDAHHGRRVWDPKRERVVRELAGPGIGDVTPDGSALAERLPGGARVWDLAAGRPGHTYLTLDHDAYLVLTPDGHFHGSPGIEKDLVYVARKWDGTQETLSPAEFAGRYGWKNDPARVGTAPPVAVPADAPAPAPLTAKERVALDWVLAVNGTVRLFVNGELREYRQGGKLPDGPCLVHEVSDLAALDDTTVDKLRPLLLAGGEDSGLGLQLSKLTDAGLAKLVTYPGLKRMRVLTLAETAVGDDGLAHLAGLAGLTELHVEQTKVTEAGVKKLAAALPKCKIVWDGGAIEPKKEPAADPDRAAAEWVVSVGGTVVVNDRPDAVKERSTLPRDPFRLTGIDLRRNDRVNDAAMARFKDCRALRRLYLHAVNVTDAGLAAFGGRTDLLIVSLQETGITDAGLAAFGQCKDLEHLDLTNNRIGDAGVARLKPSDRLRTLRLGKTAVTDAGLAHFKGCKSIVDFNVPDTAVGDAGLEHFRDYRSKALWYLTLQGTKVTDAGLASFRDCNDLKTLDLGRTKVTDAGLAQFADCKGLTHLGLEETAVTDEGVAPFAACQALARLKLQKTKVTEAGVKKLAAALPGCKIEWDGGTIEPAKK